MDCDLSSEYRYPPFEQLGPVKKTQQGQGLTPSASFWKESLFVGKTTLTIT